MPIHYYLEVVLNNRYFTEKVYIHLYFAFNQSIREKNKKNKRNAINYTVHTLSKVALQ